MQNRVSLIRAKLGSVVSMLAERNIEVTQRGTKAYVGYRKDGSISHMNLPYVPDDASDQFLSAIEGYLDHEVGHALFTDPAAAIKAKDKGLLSYFNIVEDTFVERMMRQKFRGSTKTLNDVVDYLLREFTDKALARGEDPAPYLLVPVVRALAGQTACQDYMSDKWHLVRREMDAVGDYLKENLPTIDCSERSLQVAAEVKRLLGDIEPPSEGNDQGEGSGSPENENESESENENSSEQSGGSQDRGDGQDQQDGDSQGDGEPDGADENKQGKRSDGDGQDQQDGDGGPGDGSQDESGESGEKKEKKAGRRRGRGSQKSRHEAESEPPEPHTFDDGVESLLSEASVGAMEHAKYRVWTTDYDKVEVLEVSKVSAGTINQMTEAVDHMVGPMQKDLERAIAARSLAVWSPGQRSGRLHSAALARLTTFGDDRVFRRKHENITNDVAVTLLVDCSGSMTMGDRIKTACYAAYALSGVLDRIRVPSEILGFTTGRNFPSTAENEMRALGLDYARDESILMPIFKSFNERNTPTVRARLADTAVMSSGLDMRNNVDGESVQIAAGRLAGRKEKRKILMVLSDGYPASSGNDAMMRRHLAEAVKEVERAGIDVLGIGINSDSVKKFYPKAVVLTRVSELPKVVIGEIKRLLIRG